MPISSQIFVPHAPGNLVVAIDAANHEELLGNLRALRQHVERAWLQPARDGELSGALRGGHPQERSLHLDEALAIHRPPERGVHFRPQPEVPLHPLAAKVDISVLKPYLLISFGPRVQRERRRLSCGEDFHFVRTDFDLTRVETFVRSALRTEPHRARHPHDVFRPKFLGAVDNTLDDAGVVPHVYERQVLALLAPSRHPTTDRDLLAGIFGSQAAAKVCAETAGARRVVAWARLTCLGHRRHTHCLRDESADDLADEFAPALAPTLAAVARPPCPGSRR